MKTVLGLPMIRSSSSLMHALDRHCYHVFSPRCHDCRERLVHNAPEQANTAQALLSMPFMENVELFQSIGSIWLWFVLTIPTTTSVFMFYWYYKRDSDKRAGETRKDET